MNNNKSLGSAIDLATPSAEVKKQKFRAIDLYSGIGGWSLGLEMAGIDVAASFE